MRRAARVLGAGLALLALSAGGRIGEAYQAVRITPDHPSARLRIEAPGRDVVGLRLARIENPRMVPFGVIVSVPDGPEIGRFAIYPPDRTGDYMLSLAADERSRLAAAGEIEARLHLSAPAPGLAVEIAVAPAPPAAGQ